MLTAWYSGLEESLIYYYTAGKELTSGMLFLYLLVVWIYCLYIFFDYEATEKSLLSRINDAGGVSLFTTLIFGTIFWFPLNFLLGFVFGPIQP